MTAMNIRSTSTSGAGAAAAEELAADKWNPYPTPFQPQTMHSQWKVDTSSLSPGRPVVLDACFPLQLVPGLLFQYYVEAHCRVQMNVDNWRQTCAEVVRAELFHLSAVSMVTTKMMTSGPDPA